MQQRTSFLRVVIIRPAPDLNPGTHYDHLHRPEGPAHAPGPHLRRGPAPLAAQPPPDDDLHRRSDRHRPVRGLGGDDLQCRSRRRAGGLCGHRRYGVAHYAVAGRDGGLPADGRVLRRVRDPLRLAVLRIRHRLELLVQLGDHRGGRAGGGGAGG